MSEGVEEPHGGEGVEKSNTSEPSLTHSPTHSLTHNKKRRRARRSTADQKEKTGERYFESKHDIINQVGIILTITSNYYNS